MKLDLPKSYLINSELIEGAGVVFAKNISEGAATVKITKLSQGHYCKMIKQFSIHIPLPSLIFLFMN
jgi:hypothetical protein